MKVLILSTQATGASTFAYFMGQGSKTVSLVDCFMPKVSDIVPVNAEHMVVKQNLHPRDLVSVDERVQAFKPDRVFVFIRHPADIWTSLQTRSFRDIGGSPEEKLIMLDRLVASDKYTVLRHEDFIGSRNLFLIAINGCIPGMDIHNGYYDFPRSFKDMVEFNTESGFKWYQDYASGGVQGGKVEAKNPRPVPKDVMKWINQNCPALSKLYAGDQRTLVDANPKRDKFTFHYVAAGHLPVVSEYSACAYTQKIHKLTRMLLKKGHRVVLYGVGRTDISHPNLEFVPLLTMEEVRAEWGDKDFHDPSNELGYDHKVGQFRHDMGQQQKTKTTEKFLKNAIEEIRKRNADDHFLLLSLGNSQKEISDSLKMPMTVEPGVGYTGVIGPFIAYESEFLKNWVSGHTTSGDIPDGRDYDRVIPNYYDLNDFPFVAKGGEYLIFMGRIIERKGFMTAYHVSKTLGIPIKIVGQGHLPEELRKDPMVTYLGAVGAKERAKLLGNAAVAFVPTVYMEPFGGVSIEANLCGTPVITTDFGVFPETIENGVNGYRCSVFDEFVSRTVDAMKLDRVKVREYAESHFSMDVVSEKYEEWWKVIYNWYLGKIGFGGWWWVGEDSRWKISQALEHLWRNKKENIYSSLTKQSSYFEDMGIKKDYPNLDLGGKRVLDVGGGVTSMLHSCLNFEGAIVDPGLSFEIGNPYDAAGIWVIDQMCEKMTEEGWDEVWVYDVLKYVRNQAEAAKRILRAGKVIRIWEPISSETDKRIIYGLSVSDCRLLYGNMGKVVNVPWKDGDVAYTAVIVNK